MLAVDPVLLRVHPQALPLLRPPIPRVRHRRRQQLHQAIPAVHPLNVRMTL